MQQRGDRAPKQPWEKQVPVGGFGEEESDYEAVKPVGYEERLAFQREQGGKPPVSRPLPPRPPAPPAWRPPAPPMGQPLPPGGTRPQVPQITREHTHPFPPQTGQQPPLPPEPPLQEVPMERSRELMEKKGPFWTPVGEKMVDKPKKSRTLQHVLIFLAVALVVGILLRSVLFTVRAAKVSGNIHMTETEILQTAGIALGQNMFSLDEGAVERQVNANHYLSFVRLRRDWPDGVTLFVEERVPTAYANAYGMLFLLAADGTVLEDSSDIDTLPSLPLVQGLQAGTVMVGRKITTGSVTKLQAYTEIMEEVRIQGCLSQISVLNMSNVDNIFLVTTDGYTVQLGSKADIRAKIGAMRAVRLKLIEMDVTGGTIFVNEDPIHPTYMP